jgi:hypothetical protein
VRQTNYCRPDSDKACELGFTGGEFTSVGLKLIYKALLTSCSEQAELVAFHTHRGSIFSDGRECLKIYVQALLCIARVGMSVTTGISPLSDFSQSSIGL